MACILKIPSKASKGIVIFTSQEKTKAIEGDQNLQKRIRLLKDKWVFGIHHNWHDHKFEYNDLYDFEIAGEKYLIEKSSKSFNRLELSAANFVPNHFRFSKSTKFWDILYVGRSVHFKNIPDFFSAIRKLYDDGKMYRVLFIAPIHPECKKNKSTSSNFCNIVEIYEEMFTSKERGYFNLLTLEYDYPFPFDLDTLSHFYKSSKVFVYTSDDEMRPRTVGYAIASGLPIVVRESISYMLPKAIRKAPFIYVAKDKNLFPNLIDEAIKFSNSKDYSELSMKASVDEFDNSYNKEKMRGFFLQTFDLDIYSDKPTNLLNDLDIRIARHHGMGDHKNGIGWSLDSLLNYLEMQPLDLIKKDALSADFEKHISRYNKYGIVHKKSIVKTPVIIKIKIALVNLSRKYSLIARIIKRYKRYKDDNR